jgi:carbonic anhydrase/acetyltransferase-like protein (isoleucine patch superfamily)
LLFPRVQLTATNVAAPVLAPANWLTVFNTSTSGTGATAVSPGLYYWDNTSSVWVRFQSGNTPDWSTRGNAGTDPTQDFLGTTDDQPLIIKINNQPAGLVSNSTGTSTFLGYNSGLLNTGASNVGIGNFTLAANTTGIWNTAVGERNLIANTTGNYNTALGAQTLFSNTTGINNTALGSYALAFNTTGGFNIGVGTNALRDNLTGNSNAAVGATALSANTTGYSNIAFGSSAMRSNTTGFQNVALGVASLFFNTTGNWNTAVGWNTMRGNLTGNDNTALGRSALYTNTAGSENAAVGRWALYTSEASFNTAVGFYALQTTTTGNGNTAVGHRTGLGNATGTNNTFIGINANASANALTNATAIGANAVVGQSNTMVLGDNAVRVGLGTSTPTEKLHVVGNGLFSGTVSASCGVLVCSDERYKKDIQPIQNSLSKLLQVRPVTYNWKTAEFKEKNFNDKLQIGVIAQDLEKIYPELVATDAQGYKTVDYSKFTPLLIDALQTQAAEMQALRAELEELKKLIKK